MSFWDDFLRGAAKGFDEFREVSTTDKTILDAMGDIKDFFSDDDDED